MRAGESPDVRGLAAYPMGSMVTDDDDDESMESEDVYGDEMPLDGIVDGELDIEKLRERDEMQQDKRVMNDEVSSTLAVQIKK